MSLVKRLALSLWLLKTSRTYLTRFFFIFPSASHGNAVWQSAQAKNLRNSSYMPIASGMAVIVIHGSASCLRPSEGVHDVLSQLNKVIAHKTTELWYAQRGKLFGRDNVTAEIHLEVALDGQSCVVPLWQEQHIDLLWFIFGQPFAGLCKSVLLSSLILSRSSFCFMRCSRTQSVVHSHWRALLKSKYGEQLDPMDDLEMITWIIL